MRTYNTPTRILSSFYWQLLSLFLTSFSSLFASLNLSPIKWESPNRYDIPVISQSLFPLCLYPSVSCLLTCLSRCQSFSLSLPLFLRLSVSLSSRQFVSLSLSVSLSFSLSHTRAFCDTSARVHMYKNCFCNCLCGQQATVFTWESADPFSSLRRMGHDFTIIMLCATVFLSYLPEVRFLEHGWKTWGVTCQFDRSLYI